MVLESGTANPARAMGSGARPPGSLHVAIIMDGSGRWAEARGLDRLDGHRAGERVVRHLLRAAPALGIGTLTLFAFSSDNWKRPPSEVAALLALLRDFLLDFQHDARSLGIRLDIIGCRERLTPDLQQAIHSALGATQSGQGLHLRLAIDYSARDMILRAAQACAGDAAADRDGFARALQAAQQARFAAPAVDLLIRTGGEQRLSDFLLWESAYAELYFTTKRWPEFGPADLEAAIHEFSARERRFGCLPRPTHV